MKQIKELAVQADNYAYKMNPEEDSYGRPANPRKFQQDRDAKFAELIINECADTVTDRCEMRNESDVKRAEYYAGRIKDHFGLQE